MAHVVIGEKVINKNQETGTITSYTQGIIITNFQGRVKMYDRTAFATGDLIYENADEQEKAKAHQIKLDQKAERMRVAKEKANEQRLKVQEELSKVHPNISVVKAQFRFDPAVMIVRPVKTKDQPLVRKIFAECDKDIKDLYNLAKPEMSFLRCSAYHKSKYCVGFLCKYLDSYVFRVFSRNDDYRKTCEGAITVKLSDVTEVLRILVVNNHVYYFFKNLRPLGGYLINTNINPSWHVSKPEGILMVNEVIRNCDCGDLNDYITAQNVDCLQYLNLMIPALYNPKAEIAFRHKLFTAAHRIEDLEAYLEDYTIEQITIASENNALNALPFINCFSTLEPEILKNLEAIMKKRKDGRSIYTAIQDHIHHRRLTCKDLDKKLIEYLKKVENFQPAIYRDYIDLLGNVPRITVHDFFAKDYRFRHLSMSRAKSVCITPAEITEYREAAMKLAWINREDNGYLIILPKCLSAFKLEEATLNNYIFACGYYHAVIDRNSIIVFLRKAPYLPLITIEFDYETFEVYQAYADQYSNIDPELYQYIVDLGQRLRCEMSYQQ